MKNKNNYKNRRGRGTTKKGSKGKKKRQEKGEQRGRGKE
jgi:hypothetical protein